MFVKRKLPIPHIFLDANRVNARGTLAHVNLLERWSRAGVIEIRMPWDAQLEAEYGNSNRRRKASSYIAPVPLIGTDSERHELEIIKQILFGNATLTEGQRRDALIVFTARKYFGILVTADGASKSQPRGILGAAKQLHSELGIEVMSDVDAVAMIQREIALRDRAARKLAHAWGKPEPEWCGHD